MSHSFGGSLSGSFGSGWLYLVALKPYSETYSNLVSNLRLINRQPWHFYFDHPIFY